MYVVEAKDGRKYMGTLARRLAILEGGEPVLLLDACELIAPAGLTGATIAAGSFGLVDPTPWVSQMLVYDVAAIYVVNPDAFRRYKDRFYKKEGT